jgi:hypothetical protein
MSEPQHNLTVDHLEVVDGRDRNQIEGWIPEMATEAELRDALEQAFDYRGDVTITRKDGSRVATSSTGATVRRSPSPSSVSSHRIRARKFPFLIPTSPPWPSPGVTPPPARAGKPGSASTGRGKLPARRASRWNRRIWTRPDIQDLLFPGCVQPSQAPGAGKRVPRVSRFSRPG